MMDTSLQTVLPEGYEEEVSLAVIVLSLTVCIFGIVGNSMAIFIIMTLKEYQRSITHWYVLHLAIADSVFLLTMPFQVSSEMNQVWIYSEWMCKAKEAILFCNYYASILFLMVMSIDRYVAVCHNFTFLSKWLRKIQVAFIIAPIVWIIALGISIPVILFSGKTGEYPDCKCSYEFPKPLEDDCQIEGLSEKLCKHLLLQRENKMHCLPNLNDSIFIFENPESFLEEHLDNLLGDENMDVAETSGSGDESSVSGSIMENFTAASPGSKINPHCHYDGQSSGFIWFLYFNFVVMFILPLLIMVACYGLITVKLFNTRVKTALPTSSFTASSGNLGSKQSQKKKQQTRSQIDRRRVTIMCAALVTCFVICWLPFHAVHLAKIVGIKDTETQVCSALFKFGTLLAYVNSALNPYLYSFLGTNFGKRWRSATISFRRTFSIGSMRKSSTGSFASIRPNPNRNKERKTSNTGLTKMSKGHELKSNLDAIPQTEPPHTTSVATNKALDKDNDNDN